MRGLVWKIFFWVWSALFVFSVTTVTITSYVIEQIKSEQDLGDTRSRLIHHLEEARLLAQSGGRNALSDWLKTLDRTEILPIYVVDELGDDLLGRKLPPFVYERLRRQSLEGMHPRHGPRRFALALPDGALVYFIPDFSGVTLARVLKRPRILAVPLLVGALVSAIVCLLLARYLTSPIRRLQHATEQIAAGNLQYRVAPSLGARNDELAELGRAFDNMSGRLETLLASHRQLVSDVSHELRSPLARLQVALELARQQLAPTTMPALDRIEREAERLTELVAQLLSLSRLESGVTLEHREPLDLSAMLEEIAADARFEAQTGRRDVRIVRTQPTLVDGDPTLLHSAIENVVRNALRHTPADTCVELTLAQDARWAYISVRDHGPGVDPEMLTRIFEPFVRLSGARERSSGGHGLGLAISARAVRAHGGTIDACNAPDGGLRVRLALPIARVEK